MRIVGSVCLIGVLLAGNGCGRKAPPVVKPATGFAVSPGGGVLNTAPVVVADLTRSYKGRTAEQWGEQLAARDAGVRQEAATALRALGSVAAPQLLQGMKNPSPEVRLQALEALAVPVVTQNPQATLPVLLLLLNDPIPAVREQAAIRLSWFDRTASDKGLQAGLQAQQRIKALENCAQNDPHPSVRIAAANSLQCIRSAMSGKVASD